MCNASTTILKLEIDYREQKIKEYLNYHKYNYNEYIVKKLDVGDFIIEDKLIIERKTLIDLSASIIDKRIYRQIDKLKQTGKPFCFIIEGNRLEYIKKQQKKYNHLLPIKSLNTRLHHMKEDNIKIFYSTGIVDTLNIIELYLPTYYKLLQ